MAEQKTGLEGSRFPRIHGLQRTLSFLSRSLAHSPALAPSPFLSLSLFCLALFSSLSKARTTYTHNARARAHSLSLCYARALSLARSLPPYLHLARSHLFVAGLDMLSWDSAAGFSEGTLPGPWPYGGHSRAQHHHLVHDVAGTGRAPISNYDHVTPRTRTIIPSFALGCSRPPPISVCETTRARSLLALFFSLPLSSFVSHSLSLSLFSRNCRHGTSYTHIGRPRRGSPPFPSFHAREKHARGTHARHRRAKRLAHGGEVIFVVTPRTIGQHGRARSLDCSSGPLREKSCSATTRAIYQ